MKILILEKLKNTKAQALLLVIFVSIVCFLIVLGIASRTNTQLTIQRQNSDYEVAFQQAEGGINALASVIYNYDYNGSSNGISDLNTSTSDLVAKIKQSFPCTNQSITLLPTCLDSFTLNIDPISTTTVVPIQLPSDSSNVIVPFSNLVKVGSINVWCDESTNSNTAIIIQPVFSSPNANSSSQMATLGFICSEDSNKSINQDSSSYWYLPPAGTTKNNLGNLGFDITSPNNNDVPIGTVNYKTFTLSPSSHDIYIKSLRVIMKNNFNHVTTNKSSLFDIKILNNGGNNIIGMSDPITGTAVGYSSNSNRTATIHFSIPNTSQLPNFLNYVLFN